MVEPPPKILWLSLGVSLLFISGLWLTYSDEIIVNVELEKEKLEDCSTAQAIAVGRGFLVRCLN